MPAPLESLFLGSMLLISVGLVWYAGLSSPDGFAGVAAAGQPQATLVRERVGHWALAVSARKIGTLSVNQDQFGRFHFTVEESSDPALRAGDQFVLSLQQWGFSPWVCAECDRPEAMRAALPQLWRPL